jgi:gliding motility-associated-like protein
LATCDDGSCQFDCPDPGNCNDGICANGQEQWNGTTCACETIAGTIPTPCTDDGVCSNGTETWDNNNCTCTQTNVPTPCTDDGVCSNGTETWDNNTCTCSQTNVPTPCTDDSICANGTETWDNNTCTCNIIPTVLGCTNPTANNYNPSATCDDGSCQFDCPDPGNCNDGICANGQEQWNGTTCACETIAGTIPTPCTDDGVCSNGTETWDNNTCTCTQTNVPTPCTDDGVCSNGTENWDNNTCTCSQTNVPTPCTDDGVCSNGTETWDNNTCACNIIPAVLGCTNPTANNYNPLATCDDGSCQFACPDPGNCNDGICANGQEQWNGTTCACETIAGTIPTPCTDDGVCSNGVETWDNNTCACNIIPAVLGCTNPTANNYNPLATCDDGSCQFACPDPGNCNDGICANGQEQWNGTTCACETIAGTIPTPCTDDGVCSNGTETWDNNNCTCTQTNVPTPCTDDGVCSNGVETWDNNTCACNIIPAVLGCTNPTANNYNPSATCDDGSCQFDCPDPGNCNDGICANGQEQWNGTTCACETIAGTIPTPCTDDGVCSNGTETWDNNTCTCTQTNVPTPCTDDGVCSNGTETWDNNTCTCNIIPTVLGCTNPTANNYNPLATCDDGSCQFACPDPGNCNDGICSNGVETWDGAICACVAGIPVTPLPCDDNNCNTADSYDMLTCACTHTPIPPPTCDDNDCNTTDSYNANVCECENIMLTPPNCDDGDSGTADSYDLETCACQHTALSSAMSIPTAFSPNGDGVNDIFRPQGRNFVVAHIQIFNRWGNEVYNDSISETDSKGWNGTWQNQSCEIGTYLYVINVQFDDGKTDLYKGNLTLIR